MKKAILLVSFLLGALILMGQKSAAHPSLHGGFTTNITGNYSNQYNWFSRFQIGSHGDFGYGRFGRLAAMAEIDMFPVIGTVRAGLGLKFGTVTTIVGMGAFTKTETFINEVRGDTKFQFCRVSSNTGRLRFDIQVDWRGDLSLSNVVNYRGNASYPLAPCARLEIWLDKPLGVGAGWIQQLSSKNNTVALNLRIGTKPVPGADGGNFSSLSVAAGLRIELSDKERTKRLKWENGNFAGR